MRVGIITGRRLAGLTWAVRSARPMATSVRLDQQPSPQQQQQQQREWIKEWPSREEAQRDPDAQAGPDEVILPPFAGGPQHSPLTYRASPDEPVDRKRARLLMMSRKRGILEMDLILSTWVGDGSPSSRLASLTPTQLEELDQLMAENDWDLFYWSTGAKRAPARMRALSIWEEVSAHARNDEGRRGMRMPSL
jgi:succinate dehydrogenase assembly factor 2